MGTAPCMMSASPGCNFIHPLGGIRSPSRMTPTMVISWCLAQSSWSRVKPTVVDCGVTITSVNILLAELLLQGLQLGFRQKSPPEQKEIDRTANENGGSNRREIKEANSMARSLVEKIADNDATTCADQRPLTTERCAISGAEKVARGRRDCAPCTPRE